MYSNIIISLAGRNMFLNLKCGKIGSVSHMMLGMKEKSQGRNDLPSEDLHLVDIHCNPWTPLIIV